MRDRAGVENVCKGNKRVFCFGRVLGHVLMETKRSFAKTGSGLTHQSLRKKFKHSFSFSVHRYGSAGRVSVAFATSDGVALAGKDYIAQKGSLVFEDGAENAFVLRAIFRLKTINVPRQARDKHTYGKVQETRRFSCRRDGERNPYRDYDRHPAGAERELLCLAVVAGGRRLLGKGQHGGTTCMPAQH